MFSKKHLQRICSSSQYFQSTQSSCFMLERSLVGHWFLLFIDQYNCMNLEVLLWFHYHLYIPLSIHVLFLFYQRNLWYAKSHYKKNLTKFVLLNLLQFLIFLFILAHLGWKNLLFRLIIINISPKVLCYVCLLCSCESFDVNMIIVKCYVFYNHVVIKQAIIKIISILKMIIVFFIFFFFNVLSSIFLILIRLIIHRMKVIRISKREIIRSAGRIRNGNHFQAEGISSIGYSTQYIGCTGEIYCPIAFEKKEIIAIHNAAILVFIL